MKLESTETKHNTQCSFACDECEMMTTTMIPRCSLLSLSLALLPLLHTLGEMSATSSMIQQQDDDEIHSRREEKKKMR